MMPKMPIWMIDQPRHARRIDAAEGVDAVERVAVTFYFLIHNYL